MPMDNTNKDRKLEIDPDEVEFIITRLRLLQEQTRRQLVTQTGSHLIHSKFDAMVTASMDLELLLDQYTDYPTRGH